MINGKEYTYYECTQKQRSMERDIRAIKREINACEALGMDSKELQSKLKMKMSEYRKFSDSANLKSKNNRLRIQKGSISLRDTRTYRKYVSASRENAIAGSNIVSAQSKSRAIKEHEIVKKGALLDKPIFDDSALGRAYRSRNVEDKGKYYDIVGHGSPEIIEFFGQNVSDEVIKKILEAREDYNGQVIRLISCSTGVVDENGNCFAQRLADIMGVEVIAPNGLLNIHPNGKITIGANPYRNTGEMITFKPRRSGR